MALVTIISLFKVKFPRRQGIWKPWEIDKQENITVPIPLATWPGKTRG